MPEEQALPAASPLLSLDELCHRVSMSVRNVRFYTSRGLLPAPIRQGRSGVYSPQHVARLELVAELQSHGFTLAAIEKYLSSIPAESSPEDIALHRAMLAPWSADLPVEMTPAELSERAGRELTAHELHTLGALGIVSVSGERHLVVTSQLSIGLSLLELGFPTEAAIAAGQIYAKHGRELATELNEVFATMLWPAYKENPSTEQAEKLQTIVERLKPLSIASLVTAYELAIDEQKRAKIAERSER